MIDEEIRAKAVADVKKGGSYKQVSKKYGFNSPSSVRYWCIKAGVRSPFIHTKTTDEEVLGILKELKAATSLEIAKIIGCTSPFKRLETMVIKGKIQRFRIPCPNAAAAVRKVFPTNYIGMKIYYITKEAFVEWVRGHLPHHMSKGTQNSVSQMFRGTGINIFAEGQKRREYKTLEQQIMGLWKSRGMDVEIIQFHCEDKKEIWTITAKLKELNKNG